MLLFMNIDNDQLKKKKHLKYEAIILGMRFPFKLVSTEAIFVLSIKLYF